MSEETAKRIVRDIERLEKMKSRYRCTDEEDKNFIFNREACPCAA